MPAAELARRAPLNDSEWFKRINKPAWCQRGRAHTPQFTHSVYFCLARAQDASGLPRPMVECMRNVRRRATLPPSSLPTSRKAPLVNRRQLALIVVLNAIISLTIAFVVVWAMDARRPDAEELAALAGAASLSASGAGGQATIDLPPTATSPAGAPAQTPAALPPAAEDTAADAASDAEAEIYVVQPGETLSAIAAKLGVTVQELVEANGLDNADFVFSGQRLKVPGSGPAVTPTPAGAPLGTTGLKIRSIAEAGNLAGEYVEIINDTDLSFNLQGWRLQRAGGPEYVFGDLLVFPGGSVRLYSMAGADTTIARYWGQGAPVWSSGATAVLVNAQGEPVAEYAAP